MLNNIIIKKIFTALICIGVALIIYIFIRGLFIKYVNNHKNKINKKKQTYLRLVQSLIKYVLLLLLVLFILHLNGINVTSLVAGLGIISVIAGLAIQDALKDIIQGFNLIIDDYYSVGDIIKIDEYEGKIIELGLKATKLKDINNGQIYTIANRNITQALIMSNCDFIRVPLPYEENKKRIDKILTKVCKDIQKIDYIDESTYLGIVEFKDSCIEYLIEIKTKTENLRKARREALGIIKETLDKENISIPYMQVDIHKK